MRDANHVHALIETHPGFPLGEVVHSWKSFSAKVINQQLGRAGTLWHPDYYDRYIRDDAHLHAVIEYIESNPVKAGLVARKEDWPYSSAAQGREVAEGTDGLLGARETRAVPDDARGTRAVPGFEDWSGAKGLAKDVRYYGKWMRDEAERRIGHLYPKIEITPEMAAERPDLKPLLGQKLTVIAWLWARTVKSPNPAFSHVHVPLASTFVLSSKAGKEAYVQPQILPSPSGRGAGGEGYYRFTVRLGKPPEGAKHGTAVGKQAGFICLLSGSPIDYAYIRAEGKAGRMGAKLMAIVAEGSRGRVYLPPTEEQAAIAEQAQPSWKPETPLPEKALGFRVQLYGMNSFGDLFTPPPTRRTDHLFRSGGRGH